MQQWNRGLAHIHPNAYALYLIQILDNLVKQWNMSDVSAQLRGRAAVEWVVSKFAVGGFHVAVSRAGGQADQTDQFFKINNNIATDLGIYVKNYSLNFWQLMHYQHSTLMLIIIHWWPVGWLPKCIHFIHICMLNLISISYFCVGDQWKLKAHQ